jgi:hypothetical protein
VTLGNALGAFHLAHTHDIPELRERALRFVRDSWPGMRARHGAADLEAVLGRELFAALEREQAELDAAVRRLKTLGEVVERAAGTPAPLPEHASPVPRGRTPPPRPGPVGCRLIPRCPAMDCAGTVRQGFPIRPLPHGKGWDLA